MSKTTQIDSLFFLLKAAGKAGISKENIAKELGVGLSSVPVYIFNLRKQHGVELGHVKQGKQILRYFIESYRTTPKNYVPAENEEVHRTFRNKFAKAKIEKAKTVRAEQDLNEKENEEELESKFVIGKNGAFPTFDPDMEITKINDRDFRDIRSSVGLDHHGSFARYSE
jgi:biotin operon repressor